MALKTFKPITSAQRGLVLVDNSSLYKGKPIKKAFVKLADGQTIDTSVEIK